MGKRIETMSKTDKKENEGLGYALSRIASHSIGSMKPKAVVKVFKTRWERNLYIASVFINPAILYFLTHNKHFFMRINIKLYIVAGLFGYFVEKGTVLAFKENWEKVDPKHIKERMVTNMKLTSLTNKYEKKLTEVLTALNIPHTIAKTLSNEFATQIYILSDVQIKTVLNNEKDIAKRMNLENKNLTISVEKGYFVFDIRNSNQKIYYFDEYMKRINKKQLVGKELPFILGIQQSTGKLIVEDLASMLSSLIAGSRGSGKSVFVNNLIQSLMALNSEDNNGFILPDFKGNELCQYKDFKNCLFINSHTSFDEILGGLINEMESRYEKLGKLKSLKDYNKLNDEKLPYITVIIDEMACISLCDKELSESINLKLMDILNRGRACGIVIIGAMQRPSSKQIDTNVRANLDAKIAFRVSDKRETIFTETPGAEKLNRGEFIINAIGYDCERFKSLFIDDKNRNFIFKELENRYANGVKKDGFIINLDK